MIKNAKRCTIAQLRINTVPTIDRVREEAVHTLVCTTIDTIV